MLNTRAIELDLQRRGRILAIILVSMEAALVALTLVNLYQGAAQYTFTNFSLISLVFGLYVLNRLGFVRSATVITVILASLVPVLLANESSTGAYVAMVIPVLVAGYLLAPWSGAVVGALMVGLAFVLNIASLSLVLFILVTALAYLFAESLRRAENKYRSIFENAVEGIFQTTPEGRLVTANPAMAAMFGYGSPRELISQVTNVGGQLYADPGKREKLIRQVKENGTIKGLEVRGRRKDGEDIWISLSARAIEDGNGKLLSVEGTVEDITERRRAEEALRRLNQELEERVTERTSELETAVDGLRESEERYSLVAEGANEGIWDWEVRTGEMYWNDRLFEMLGLSSADFTPTFDAFVDLSHPEDQAAVREGLFSYVERGEEKVLEFRVWRVDGEYRTFQARGKIQRDGRGEPVRIAGFVRDVTEERRQQDAQRFLSESTALLSSSLDYRSTLANVAKLAVPDLADWCAVDIVEDEGAEQFVTVEQSLEPVLARTLGVPLFQEQLLRMAMVAAGFTGGQAEELRRAMGFKRSEKRMKQIEVQLREGMARNGITGDTAETIITSITSFALYGFPESHAASFALLAYASAYLKVHFPAAFYTALLNNQPMGFYHPATLVKDAQRRGVRFTGVDVQHSDWNCRVDADGSVR
ncbi:MAG TPA: PAS domain S-box protein, partial [Rubrobacteraceae bacterium]|nr:PAS domain S-box protein [Rubrobacteraceae bacterium]